MKARDPSGMPKTLPQRIHKALRAWHTEKPDGDLNDFLLARQLKAKREGVNAHLISNEILLSGLERLKQTDDGAANLLEWRFLNRETANATAYRLNVSEDIVFQRQRAAIILLADVIWNQEKELREQRRQQVEARLEPPTYTRLFGVADKQGELRKRLESPVEPWIVAVEGLGGIGKTSLADAMTRELANDTHFQDIAWVSARRRLFQLTGEIVIQPEAAVLTLEELVDRCIDQLGLTALRHRTDSEKVAGLRSFLKAQPCLLVIDNLETVADYYTLTTQLMTLVNPSKALLTTRYSLADVSGVSVLTLEQLARSDAHLLIRHEARTRGLTDLADAPEKDLDPIYKVTGGNPLAVKLIVGQIHNLSLPVALARFAGGQGRPVEELLHYFFEEAWQSLDLDCRQVLRAMLLVAEEGGPAEQITAAAQLNENTTISCLHRLANLSMINVGGNLYERLYSLHPLTQVFVTQRAMGEDL